MAQYVTLGEVPFGEYFVSNKSRSAVFKKLKSPFTESGIVYLELSRSVVINVNASPKTDRLYRLCDSFGVCSHKDVDTSEDIEFDL